MTLHDVFEELFELADQVGVEIWFLLTFAIIAWIIYKRRTWRYRSA